ncbi:isocitrate/isopropylmalate family dehydrogenase [Amycolatopsis sp. NPDC026612]|uniref:isocitrate/isopropylmalate family dehydrogenase n=1 Tax=Amycolatopsis sp. NPDC026612 TaxID=3155466 RepID=UPI0033EE6CA9
MSQRYRIAVIPGDGIGREVVPEGLRCLHAAAEAHGFELEVAEFGFACAEYWVRHGEMLPPDWRDVLGGFDAIFFGAVGWLRIFPATAVHSQGAPGRRRFTAPWVVRRLA